MARPTRQGVDYFSLDVHLDDKFKFVEIKYGLEGFAILVKLMQRIYSQGYWCNWTDDEQLLFSDEIKSNYQTVLGVVNEAIDRGIFDKRLYEKYKILTSRGIQKRYKEITRRRKGVEVITNYLLVDGDFGTDSNVITSNVGDMSTECRHDDGRSTQSKIKKSKPKESKIKQTKEKENTEDGNQGKKPLSVVVDKSFGEIISFYAQNIGSISPHIDKELRYLCEENDSTLVLIALQKSVEAKAKNVIRYTQGVLKNWANDDIKTIEDVKKNDLLPRKSKEASLFVSSSETLKRQRQEAEKYKDYVVDTSDLPY